MKNETVACLSNIIWFSYNTIRWKSIFNHNFPLGVVINSQRVLEKNLDLIV